MELSRNDSSRGARARDMGIIELFPSSAHEGGEHIVRALTSAKAAIYYRANMDVNTDEPPHSCYPGDPLTKTSAEIALFKSLIKHL
jgi:hypothetical protein